MLHYQTIPVTPFQQNCSLVWCDVTQQAAVIDPGGDLEVILDAVAQLGLKLEQIWITHAHIDHAWSMWAWVIQICSSFNPSWATASRMTSRSPPGSMTAAC